ncbi:nucleotidyltransferase family protein [Brevibacterium oceani]|uniref:nucleotidyltransferase family protein n=1 Tax=Brevibacterium oceani TaxID=358099 RepID=UPI001B33A6AC|nr:nucleotidyltransferase family protein [Brevibacterium oceani]
MSSEAEATRPWQPFAGRRPTGLVLAAGAGQRLGRGPKALLMREDGLTLVESVVLALLDGGCQNVTVVTGACREEVARALAGCDRVVIAVNPDWSSGMGSSLRRGLQAIGPGPDVMVTPVDRPGICAAEVARLTAAHRPGAITAAAHRDSEGQLRRGHPVLFDASWTSHAAAAAHGDIGARDLLAAHRYVVDLIDCSDLDDGADVDVPEDLHRLRAAVRHRR